MKKHRYQPYELAVIRSTVTKKMVQGDFGPIPDKGNKSAPRANDGGFYAKVQAFVTDNYGHTIGQGTVYKCKQTASKYVKPSTSTSSVAIPVEDVLLVKPALKIRRLRTQKIKSKMTPRQNATVSGIAAYAKEAELSTEQHNLVNALYTRYYITA